MQTVILAAGEGNRLWPLTANRPKPMLPVGNVPILESVLEAAIDAGAEDVVFVVGYGRERIQNHFGNGEDWDVSIEYVVQDRQLGAAHALAQAEPVVDGPVLVLHGDQFVDAAVLERLLDRWDRTETATVAVTQSDRATEYGAVTVEAETVTGVSTTPTTDPPFLVNAGSYVFDGSVFETIQALSAEHSGTYDIATLLRRLADGDGLSALIDRDARTTLTHLWDLLAVNGQVLHARAAPAVPDGVHDSAVVSSDVALDASVSVGPSSALLPGTSLGRNVVVGSNVTLSNCVVLEDARVGDGAVLHDCIVGEAAEIGPNATAEGGPARVVVDGSVYDDVVLGGVFGDRTRLRGAVTVEPGTVVGPGVTADCGSVLRGRLVAGDTTRRS